MQHSKAEGHHMARTQLGLCCDSGLIDVVDEELVALSQDCTSCDHTEPHMSFHGS